MSTRNPTYGFGTDPLTPDQQKLVAENVGLCYAMLRQYSSIPADRWDEVLAEAALPGLINAARSFDPAKGKFTTLACHAIVRHIRRAWRKAANHDLRWRQWGLNDGNSADIVEPTKEGQDSTAAYDVGVMLGKLTPKLRMVVEFRHLAGLKYREIAALMGRSPNNVCLLEREAMRRLRKMAR
jgi:RNA polymerase sigma factor (sigma-70 family)